MTAEEKSAIFDALDDLKYAKDMAQLIEGCEHTPASSTAYVLGQKMEAAMANLLKLVKGANG